MVYTWLLWNLDLSFWLGHHINRIDIAVAPTSHGEDFWWDDFWQIINGGMTRLQGPLHPDLWNYGKSSTIYKLGTSSYKIPSYRPDEGVPCKGLNMTVQSSDILQMWLWADLYSGDQIYVMLVDTNWDMTLQYWQYTVPPIPPPTFAPLWKKRIGEL